MLTYEEYAAIPAVNISTLLEMQRSPAHYRHLLAHGRGKETEALSLGRLVHMAVLEPDRYAAEVAVWEGGRRAGKEWEAWKAANAGRAHATVDDHETCMAISSAVREHPAAGEYLACRGALTEATMTWQHDLGIPLKARLDWVDVATGVVLDLKTSRDASEIEFGKAAARYHYATRASFYSDGYRATYGVAPKFVIIAAEKEPPYAVATYVVPEQAIESGRRSYERLLAQLKHCRETDRWPGLCDDQERELALPAWAFSDDDGLDLVVDGEAYRV